jgi:hypothetical protein
MMTDFLSFSLDVKNLKSSPVHQVPLTWLSALDTRKFELYWTIDASIPPLCSLSDYSHVL